jgi:putative transposase
MFSYSFRRNMHLEFRGREYVIEQRLPNGDIRIKDIAFNESMPIAQTELLDALFDGQLEFLGDGREISSIQRKMVKSFVEDITMLESIDPRKIEFRRRLAYIKEIHAANLTEFNAATLDPIITRVHDEIKDHKSKPCWKTVYYHWFVPFIISGGDIRAFVPLYKRCGNRKRKFTGRPKLKGQKFTETERRKAEEVATVIDEVINEEYMNEQRLSVAEVYDRLDQRIADINQFRDANDHLPIPHEDSLYDIISKMDEYEKDKARYGKLYAEHMHEQRKQGPRPTRPLERVEIDHTKLDLFIIDAETRLPVGRPTVTVIIDKYSRMIVGMHVGFDPPGYLSVMLCLLHAITPKRYVETDFPSVDNKWNTYGIPEQIIVDNALEFGSKDFEDACLQLGTHASHSPVKHPWYKAAIERFFGTQNRRLLHNQPGTTFSNIIAKGDYDPQKNAIISFDAFMEMLHLWIVDVYSQDLHRGLNDIPSHVWERGINEFPPTLPRRKQELRILLGQIEQRKISRSGIKLFNLTYNDDRLALLRRELKGKKAKLKFNPNDLSIIYVNNPKDDSYIPVLAEDQEYTKGLSLWQHEVIQNYIRKNLRSRINRDSLRRAKKKIQDIVDREWLQSHKITTRVKMARWRRVQQVSGAALELANHIEEQTINPAEPRGKPVMLNPAPSPLEGISNVGNALATFKESDDLGDNRLITCVTEATSTARKTKRISSKMHISQLEQESSDSTSPHNQNAEEVTSENQSSFTQNDDLDLTGFNSSYDLPVHGGIR